MQQQLTGLALLPGGPLIAASAGLSNSSGHRSHVRVKVLKAEAATQQATFYKAELKPQTNFFVVVRKVRSEKTRARWGAGEEINPEDQRFK